MRLDEPAPRGRRGGGTERADQRVHFLEKQLDAAGAAPAPGRLPEWKGGK